MGRFYKTNQTTPIEWIQRNPNLQLMATAIANEDAHINAQDNEVKLLESDLAKIPFLEKDRELATEKINFLNDKVTNLSKQMKDDPLKWRERAGALRDLKNEIHKEYSTGVLGNVAKNYNYAQQKFKELDERVAKGKVSAQAANAWKASYMKEYQGAYNSDTKTYNPFNWSDITDEYDLNKFFDETIKGIKADVTHTKMDEVGGAWLYTKEGKAEYVKPDDVISTLQNAAQSNVELKAYLKDREKIGIIKNTLGVDGELLPSFGYIPSPEKDEQGIIKRDPVTGELILKNRFSPLRDNIITRGILSRVARESYGKLEDFQTQDMNDVWNNNANRANQIKLEKMKEAHDITTINLETKKREDLERLKASLKPNATQKEYDSEGNVINQVDYNTNDYSFDANNNTLTSKTKLDLNTGEIYGYGPIIKDNKDFLRQVSIVTAQIKGIDAQLKNKNLSPTERQTLNTKRQELSNQSASLINIYNTKLTDPKTLGMSPKAVTDAIDFNMNGENRKKLEQEIEKERTKFLTATKYGTKESQYIDQSIYLNARAKYDSLLKQYALIQKNAQELTKKQNKYLTENAGINKVKYAFVEASPQMQQVFNKATELYSKDVFKLEDPSGKELLKGVNNLKSLEEKLGGSWKDYFNDISGLSENGIGVLELKIPITINGITLEKGKKIITRMPQGVAMNMAKQGVNSSTNPMAQTIFNNTLSSSKYNISSKLENLFTDNIEGTNIKQTIDIEGKGGVQIPIEVSTYTTGTYQGDGDKYRNTNYIVYSKGQPVYQGSKEDVSEFLNNISLQASGQE